MAEFATASDLAARLGITLTDVETARATSLITIASGLVQDEAKQLIERVDGDVVTLPGTTDETIRLPERPVISVSSVTLDGDELVEGSDWYLDGNMLRRIAPATTILADGLMEEAYTFPLGAGFGWPTQQVVITYTHGYDAGNVPQTVKAIVLEAVVRVWVNPASVARETVGNVSTVYDNMRFSPSGLLLSDDEKRTVRRIFGQRAHSITIGQ